MVLRREELFGTVHTSFLIGVDAGRQRDHSAIAVIEVHPEKQLDVSTDPETGRQHVQRMAGYTVKELHQIPLGTSYGLVVDRVRQLYWAYRGEGKVTVCVDALGPGRPLIDALQDGGLRPIAVSAHGGQQSTVDGREAHFSKEQMVLFLSRLIGLRLLKIPRRYEAMLLPEFSPYQAHTSRNGHTTYAAPDGAHDDLLCAMYIAVYWDDQQRRKPRAGTWDVLRR